MTFCPNCGTQAAGSFCPNCGTALGGGASSTSGSGFIPQGQPAMSGLSSNMVAALCYLLGIIGGVIFLLIAPYNRDPLIRFHAFQSIFFTLAWIVIGILIGIVAHGMALLIYPLYQIVFLLAWVYMIVTAYQGKKIVLPFIGELAEKQV